MKEIIYSIERKKEVVDEGVYKGVKYTILNLGMHPAAYVENIVEVSDHYDP